MDGNTIDPRFEQGIDQTGDDTGLYAAPMIPMPTAEHVQAAANAGDSAPEDFARNYANGLYADEIEAAKAEVKQVGHKLDKANTGLARCEEELQSTPKWQHFLCQHSEDGHRQPWGQRFYNAIRVPAALAGPAIGGGFLVSNMMDTSFAMAERPGLAVVSAGMIFMGSFGASSWATAPVTDFKEAEARTKRLLRVGGACFGAWAGFMAIKFGLPESSTSVGSFDLTGASHTPSSVMQMVWEWVHSQGASLFALGLHVFGDAMLSGGILSASIQSMRKTRRVKTDYTEHHSLLIAERDDWREQVASALADKSEAEARLNAAITKRDATKQITLQAIQSKKSILAAKRDQAIATVTAQLQGE